MTAPSIVSQANDYFLEGGVSPKVCYDLWDILFKYGHVNYLLGNLQGASTFLLALKEILSSVASRTLLFGKPFEHITSSSISNNDAEYCRCSLDLGECTIRKGLAFLKKEGLIVGFRGTASNKWALGLDLYKIVTTLYPYIKQGTGSSENRVLKSQEILKELIQSKPFITQTKQMSLLQGKQFNDSSSILQKELSSMAGISAKDIIAQVEKRDIARKTKAEAKRISASLLESPDVSEKNIKDFLVNWKRLVMDSELYPAYDENTEILNMKERSVVKAFLKAEYNAGRTWEELKDELRRVIDGWGRVPSKERTIAATSKAGTLYNPKWGDVPKITEYCNNRTAIRTACLKYTTLSRKQPESDKLVIAQEIAPKQTSQKASIDL